MQTKKKKNKKEVKKKTKTSTIKVISTLIKPQTLFGKKA
tara:strand:- start:7370 stop:7486 length:117 start_codon:yes stop_codon:yes gene_type:complete